MEANVKDSNCTIVFTRGKPAGGSLKTIRLAIKHGKPCIHMDIQDVVLGREMDVAMFLTGWLQRRHIQECVLNVAGSRESEAPGIQKLIQQIISWTLMWVNSPFTPQ